MEAFAAWRICSLPRRIAGSQILFLFFTRAETQRNCSPLGMTFRRGGLCAFASLRALFFFFLQSLPIRRRGGYLLLGSSLISCLSALASRFSALDT